jgi:hypothetical protein
MTAFTTPDPVRSYVDAMMELHAAADAIEAVGQFHSWLGDQLQQRTSILIDVTSVSPDQHVGAVVEQRYLDKTSFLDLLHRSVVAWQRVEGARDALSAAERRAVGLGADRATVDAVAATPDV